MASDASYGCTGAFLVTGPRGAKLKIIASNGHGSIRWEHVSVSVQHRIPNWQEMSWVKDQFFKDDECVMQLHVPKSEHINIHPNVLHLWRPLDETIPTPPSIAV
jgi:hypothetical protein